MKDYGSKEKNDQGSSDESSKKLYKERKLLEVIKILREEHTEYLKILKNE